MDPTFAQVDCNQPAKPTVSRLGVSAISTSFLRTTAQDRFNAQKSHDRALRFMWRAMNGFLDKPIKPDPRIL
jgi:hypothetical protein